MYYSKQRGKHDIHTDGAEYVEIHILSFWFLLYYRIFLIRNTAIWEKGSFSLLCIMCLDHVLPGTLSREMGMHSPHILL